MESFFSKVRRAGRWCARLFMSRTELTRRALLRSEGRARAAREAERLDRLKNPGDYRGR
jgi:hypothetical protein